MLHIGNLRIFHVPVSPCKGATIVVGPHWTLALATIAFSVVAALLALGFAATAEGVSQWRLFVLGILSVTQIGFTTAVCTSDPGIILPADGWLNDLEQSGREDEICHICQAVQPNLDTVHCEFCDACIQGFDHHCPWTGKCVGAKNKRLFWIWVVVLIVFILAAGLLADGGDY
eukprot:Protomagalhaensia_wolfi_Nauph_80__6163@NODE_904_length_1896_cov_403_341949_g681_i0_p2_GENE_NODE_904_length_1896_cov_403_341949_g681_i0NODE_904_length_1896_cov_403_341949_g681_i0_p2_ORF_typecomplete_len173_score20_79DHHC/PF01529_20/8_6e02DHHC/PF01529_20/2_4e20DUF4231/PF14015_6/1_9DUF4231/PF14015_6/16DUF5336/PF17270_2/11DUF5336/PF17270_2/52PBP_N/PF17093_5/7_1e02PBP_N/PF17093_5/1_7Myco_arth_vir_N/PF09610_10/4_3e02Myco_arth_vir_N/PF09610_10/2_9ABC2_membrane_3/PF12698_7/4_5ABC2_membrane_3/PF12698_7/3